MLDHIQQTQNIIISPLESNIRSPFSSAMVSTKSWEKHVALSLLDAPMAAAARVELDDSADTKPHSKCAIRPKLGAKRWGKATTSDTFQMKPVL